MSMVLRLLLAAWLVGATFPASAQEAPYDDKLYRLSEIMGAVQYLRTLCGERSTVWRDEMERLIEAEKPDPDRRARMIASFNRGFRSYEGHRSCTSASTESIARFMAEGELLARDMLVRFGN